MSFLKPQKIEEYITVLLSRGAMKATQLLVSIRQFRPNTTKQALYAALRQMKTHEEIVIYRGTVALNFTWLNQLTRFVATAKESYRGKATIMPDALPDLSAGDRISYRFQDPLKTDIFWTHALYLLVEHDQSGEPVYLYNPHEWFLLVRNENETEAIRTITTQGKQFLLLAGNDLPLDRYVRKYFDGTRSQYHTLPKPHFTNNRYYLNVVGNILIEVWLDKDISNALDSFYFRTKEWSREAEQELLQILKQKKRVRIMISHNRAKAETFKKFCRKFFYIKNAAQSD